MHPEQGERGLWYVGTVGFATKEQAQAYIDRGLKHFEIPEPDKSSALSGLMTQVLLGAVVMAITVIIAWWAFSGIKSASTADTQTVRREFSSLNDCLSSIADDLGDRLELTIDEPGNVSGRSKRDRFLFGCKVRATGTRWLIIEGWWDRPK